MEKLKQLIMLALVAVFSLMSLGLSAEMALAIRDNSQFEKAEVPVNPFVAKVARRQ